MEHRITMEILSHPTRETLIQIRHCGLGTLKN